MASVQSQVGVNYHNNGFNVDIEEVTQSSIFQAFTPREREKTQYKLSTSPFEEIVSGSV